MKYKCYECGAVFATPKIVEEKHGLDTPPYEKFGVCPICDATDFNIYCATVEKIDIAEKLLPAIAAFNRYWSYIKDIYGSGSKNSDFDEGIGALMEIISELFPDISVETERKVLKLQTEKEIDNIFFCLKKEM